MFVLAFSAGVPAFTQPEEVHESLSEGVAPLPKEGEGGGCKALQVGITLAASSIVTTTFPPALAATALAAAATAAALTATTIRHPSPNPNPNPPPPSPGRHHR